MTQRNEKPRDLALFARKVGIVALFAIGALIIWNARRVVILLFVAGVLAAGISPAVRRVRALVRVYTHRRIKRGTAVLIVYFPFLILAIGFAVFALPQILLESGQMMKDLPRLLDEKILGPLGPYLPVTAVRDVVTDKDFVSELPLFGYARKAIGILASVLAILFLVVYILIDAERLRNLFLLIFPPAERSHKRKIIRRIAKRMSSWLSGQLILASIIGAGTFIALTALRIPYAIPLAIVAAIGETIPIIGPIVGAVPALAVALTQSPGQFWSVLILAVLIQQIENYLIVPRVMGRKVAVAPLAVFVAFMTGASLFGIIGAIMAIPAAAIIQVVFEEWFVSRRERRQDADRPGTLAKSEG